MKKNTNKMIRNLLLISLLTGQYASNLNIIFANNIDEFIPEDDGIVVPFDELIEREREAFNMLKEQGIDLEFLAEIEDDLFNLSENKEIIEMPFGASPAREEDMIDNSVDTSEQTLNNKTKILLLVLLLVGSVFIYIISKHYYKK